MSIEDRVMILRKVIFDTPMSGFRSNRQTAPRSARSLRQEVDELRCKTCGDYIYKGRKFNARQETVKDETYLGLRIFRFYIRCPKCLSEITFKTDPENTDYTMEEGATRNFEAFRLAKKQEERLKQEKEEEELNNPMKALENRTMESRQEMEMLEKLEELKDINARHAAVDHDQLIRDHILVSEEELKRKQEEEDEALIR
eukprot:gene3291-1623_t